MLPKVDAQSLVLGANKDGTDNVTSCEKQPISPGSVGIQRIWGGLEVSEV